MLQRWIVASALALMASCAFAGTNTWTAVGPQGGEVRKIVMHPTDPETAVAIAFSGVYRTTNGGLTWTKSNYPFLYPPIDLRSDPSDPNRFYVFSSSNPRIVVSTDGGVTFQGFTNLPVSNAYEPSFGLGPGGVVYYTAGLRVFRSENRGSSWIERTAIVLPADSRIRWIVVDPSDANTLYAIAGADAGPSATFISRDGATNWTLLPNAIGNLVPNPDNAGEVWAGRTDGLWKSADYGATWTSINGVSWVSDFALNTSGAAVQIVVATSDGVLRSINGGASWSNITGDLETGAHNVAVHPVDADRIMLSGYRGISVPGTSPGSWVTRHQGIVAGHVYSFEADPTTDRIYAHADSVHVSTNGGEFEPVNNRQLATIGTPPLPKLLTTVHAQPGSLLALLTDELARSNDGGATWTLIPGFPANRLDQLWQLESARADPLNLIVAGTQSAFRSTNGGGNWTRITAGLPPNFSMYDFEFAESSPSVVYLSPFLYTQTTPQSMGVYRSTDGGTNWVAANAGIETAAVYDIEVDPTDAQTVYAIAGETFVKSTDGGTTWRTLLRSLRFNARLAIDPVMPRIIYVIYGDNNVLRSVNGGESFETVRDLSSIPWWFPRAVIVDPRRPNVVNLGTGGYGVQQISIEPDVALSWGGTPSSGTEGSAVSYVLFATNRGPFASSGARVTIQFPAGSSELAASSQGGTCTLQQTTAVCTLNSLALNSSIGVTLSAKPGSAGAFAINATVQTDQPDPVATNNAIAHSVDVVAAPSPPTPPAPPPPTPPTPPPPTTPTTPTTPTPEPAPVPAPPQTPSAPQASGGGGGGGSMSVPLLLATLLLNAVRRRRHDAITT